VPRSAVTADSVPRQPICRFTISRTPHSACRFTCLATGKKMGWTSLCGTSQLGWCVPEREWDDPPLGWVIPLFHGTPQAVETSHAMWDVPHGWAVPVWLGCLILAGVSQFGWVVPAVGHPTLKRAVPRQVGRPSALWDVPRGWAVPVWVGCPEFAGLSQF
jgi:hypothetical protein